MNKCNISLTYGLLSHIYSYSVCVCVFNPKNTVAYAAKLSALYCSWSSVWQASNFRSLIRLLIKNTSEDVSSHSSGWKLNPVHLCLIDLGGRPSVCVHNLLWQQISALAHTESARQKDILDQFPVTMDIGSGLQSHPWIVCSGSELFPEAFNGFLPLACP